MELQEHELLRSNNNDILGRIGFFSQPDTTNRKSITLDRSMYGEFGGNLPDPITSRGRTSKRTTIVTSILIVFFVIFNVFYCGEYLHFNNKIKMLDQSNFSVELPSNNPYPGNNASDFTTILSRRLNLTGAWEVKLVWISIPYSWFNIPKDQPIYLFDTQKREIVLEPNTLINYYVDPLVPGQEQNNSRSRSPDGYVKVESLSATLAEKRKHTKNLFVPTTRTGNVNEGHYDTPEKLIREINEEMKVFHHKVKHLPHLFYDPISSTVSILAGIDLEDHMITQISQQSFGLQ
jgi:hypothetical protein